MSLSNVRGRSGNHQRVEGGAVHKPATTAKADAPGGKGTHKPAAAAPAEVSTAARKTAEASRVTHPGRVQGPGLGDANALRFGLATAAAKLPPAEARAVKDAASMDTIYDAVRRFPKSRAVALAALTTSENMVMNISKAFQKDMALLKEAAVANPVLVLPEMQSPYIQAGMKMALPDARREALLKDKDVQAAVKAFQAAVAQFPDMQPSTFNNRRIFAQLVHNRANPQEVDARPRAVVIYPKDDWNGQFSGSGSYVEDLTRGYRVMYYQVESDAAFAKAVQDGTNAQKAQLLFIGGHGEPTVTAFGADDPARLPPEMRKRLEGNRLGAKEMAQMMARLAEVNEEKYLDFSDADLLAPLKNRLEAGSNIVLMSCSTGKGDKKGKNLANFLHQQFPQARVHAPTEPVPNSGVVLNKDGLFERAGFADMGKAYVAGG